MKHLAPTSFSLALRAHEFARRCLHSRATLAAWERHVALLKRSRRGQLPQALVRLGLCGHPEVVSKQARQEAVKPKHAAQIIYHCDLTTQYQKHDGAAATLKRPRPSGNPDVADKTCQVIFLGHKTDMLISQQKAWGKYLVLLVSEVFLYRSAFFSQPMMISCVRSA